MNEKRIDTSKPSTSFPVPKDIDLDTILKCDMDKYVNWLLSAKVPNAKQKKEAYNALVEVLGKKKARDLIYKESADDWRPIGIKYPNLEKPKEQFEMWREASFLSEQIFSPKFKLNVLPLDVRRENEIKRIFNELNAEYAKQLSSILNERLTVNYKEVAELMGKIDYLKTLCSEQHSKKKLENEYRSLRELFESSEIFDKSLNVLRELNVIDKANKCIVKSKGVFVLWIKEMEIRHIIKHTNEKEYAYSLNEFFKPFSISTSTFRAPQPKAKEKYQSEIKILFSSVQSVKL